MIWHVVFTDGDRPVQSRAARSRDAAIQVACELLSQSCDVRRIVEPHGASIERSELDQHFDGGRFPGLRRHAGETAIAAREQIASLQRVRYLRVGEEETKIFSHACPPRSTQSGHSLDVPGGRRWATIELGVPVPVSILWSGDDTSEVPWR
jgi:hypothetical protein